MVNHYLKLFESISALNIERIEEYLKRFSYAVQLPLPSNLNEEDALEFFTYFVPQIAGDGLTRLDALEDVPVDLREVLGIPLNANLSERKETETIVNLHRILDILIEELKIDWLGVLLCKTKSNNSKVLVKLASVGREGRSEYLLTEAVARRSNSAAAGLSARPVVINDMEESLAREDGPYSPYDDTVKSEAAIPIVTIDGKVIGVLDAESSVPESFSSSNLEILIAACVVCVQLIEPLAN